MLREVLSLIGVIELLTPEALIDRAEHVALDNPGDCELKLWVVPGTRVEGLALLILMWRSDASYSAFKRFLGIIGILALMYPHEYVSYGAKLAYTDASKCKWKPWVYLGTLLVGLLYVLIALGELRKR
ncbi:hypothetical protein [Haladaptatus caseinilyticus]|uniref:hypothetical protein n=1 Tax=Haladaptatus caseinilyticus TaxID=2993314 RepID=UPI00224B9E24|nr:hypothetical protein [Haladaptatus caseinilyticus]